MLGWLAVHSTLIGQSQTTAPFVERQILGFQVTLQANPPPEVSSYSLKERPPFGNPGNLSQGGSFDPATGIITFGPFSGGEARTLSYVDWPPDGAAGLFPVTGEAIADGSAVPVVGDGYVDIAPFPPPSLRLLLRLRPLSHQTVVQIEGDIGAVYQLQTSLNLMDWTDTGVVATPEGMGEWRAPEPAPNSRCFYRAWLIPPPTQLVGDWDYQAFDSASNLVVTGLVAFANSTNPLSGNYRFDPVSGGQASGHWLREGTFANGVLAGAQVTLDLTEPGSVDNSFRLTGVVVGNTFSGQWVWSGEGPTQTGTFVARRKSE
jgi:hypothetical protein